MWKQKIGRLQRPTSGLRSRSIEETAASVANQTFRDFVAILSIDPADDDTVAICERLAKEDGRFQVIVNERRLGWVGNTNRTFDEVRTPSFMFMLARRPLAAQLPRGAQGRPQLKGALDANSGTIVAYPDFQRFGNRTSSETLESLKGTPAERATQFLGGHLNTIPFRGLVRRRALDAGLRLHEGRYDGFFSDTLWVTELALMGDCIRVPGVLYAKRVRDGSVVRGWESWPMEKKADAMIDHLAMLVAALGRSGLSEADQALAVNAATGRLSRIPAGWRPFNNDEGRDLFMARLMIELAGRKA